MQNKFFHHTLFALNVLVHPLFLPVYLMIWYLYFPTHYPIIYNALIPNDIKLNWLLLFSAMTTLVPGLILIMLKTFRYVNSFTLEHLTDRRYFYLFMGIYYWIMFYFLSRTNLMWGIFQDLFKISFILILTMSVLMFLLSLLIHSTFKASLHSAGYGILTGFFVSLVFIYKDVYLKEIIVSLIISALIMILRIVSEAHNFIESITGWTLGLLISISVFLYNFYF